MNNIQVPVKSYVARVEFGADCPSSVAALAGIVIIPGPRGKPGVGEQGPPGEAKAHVHEQMMPSALWVIEHGWLSQPIVAVTDGGASEIIGDVTHPSVGVTTIKFAFPIIGKARLI